MDRSVSALINFGAIDCWTKPGTRVTGLGITLGHGSWPIQPGWDKTRATGNIVVWPNPDVGTVRENPGRFGTIAEWKPKRATGWFLFDFFRQLKQFALDLEAIRTPLLVPWGPGFSGAGGTQPESPDNGVLIDTKADGSEGIEIQGLAPIEDNLVGRIKIAQINQRAMAPVAAIGHFWCDGVGRRAPGVIGTGSQGPIWKRQGLMRPNYLAGPVDDCIRTVIYNAQFGTGATHARNGWVEHPEARQPYRNHPVTLPMGNDPRMIPCYQGWRLVISDSQIQAWLDWSGATGALRESKWWLAVNLRGDGRRATMRAAESGTGWPIFESSGGVQLDELAAWRGRGLKDEPTANALGAGLFDFGQLVEAA